MNCVYVKQFKKEATSYIEIELQFNFNALTIDEYTNSLTVE